MHQNSRSPDQVYQVIPTAAVFAAVLERLNRQSTVALLQELSQEIDAQGQISARLAETLAARQRYGWRTWIGFWLLALLLTGGVFTMGLFTGRRSTSTSCPPPPAAAAAKATVGG